MPYSVRLAGVNLDSDDPGWSPVAPAAAIARRQARAARCGWRGCHSHHGVFPFLALAAILTLAGGGVVLSLVAVLAVLSVVVLMGLLVAGAVMVGMRSLQSLQAVHRPPLAATGPAFRLLGPETAPASWAGSRDAPGLPAPLAARYARGEISATEFRRHLMDVLKLRYVRGEISLAEYEAHLTRVLRDPLTR